MTVVAGSRTPDRKTAATAHPMKPFQRSGGAVLRINASLLVASTFAGAAWWAWPNSTRWWALGLISIAFGVVAFAMLGQAVKAMANLYRRDRALAAYLGQGEAPKSARLASDDSLRRAGMIR